MRDNLGDGFATDADYEDKVAELIRKDYLSLNHKLTLRGKKYLDSIDVESDGTTDNSGDFYDNLHKDMQNKMMELTGRKQKMIQGKYPFICNTTDLKIKLQLVIKKYGCSDREKIRNVLLSYIEKCASANFEMVHIIEYYLMKNGFSKFATDYENYEEEGQEIEQLPSTTDI